MPLYEYRCRDCGHVFEALVRQTAPTTCPVCNAEALDRVLSAFAVSSESTRQANRKTGRAHRAKKDMDRRIALKEEFDHHQH